MDIESLKIWHKFNCYTFVEDTHTYYYNGSKVRFSVTQYISRFFEEFDSERVSAQYAKKHGLNQIEVLEEWNKRGKIASISGTIIHSFLENAKRGKVFEIDYSEAKKVGLLSEVEERVNILLPQASAFHQDTLNKLFPIQLEYTVGIEDIIAGNIDLLCWNEKDQEFQIWDYKNLREFTTTNKWGNCCKESFSHLQDCSLSHYSIQLNTYKAILQRVLGIKIGKCYLVHFNYENTSDGFQIYKCLDLQKECDIELNKLIESRR